MICKLTVLALLLGNWALFYSVASRGSYSLFKKRNKKKKIQASSTLPPCKRQVGEQSCFSLKLLRLKRTLRFELKIMQLVCKRQ